MASPGEFLARAACAIPRPSAAQQRVLGQLHDLQSRLDEGRLRVAALGQFKRGKSTLLNALLGSPLLPMGVMPVTAIPTFIRVGEKPSARITLNDEKKTVITVSDEEIPSILEEFISEARNPHNRRRVASVTIETPSDFLAKGVILVDTPGVGSTFRHNTAAAEAALAECDAALFVLSADPPITEVEVDYLEKIRKLIPRVFFVLNKADLLDEPEKLAAERFLASVLQERGFVAPDGILLASSRRGLRAKLDNDDRALEDSGPRLERTLAGELANEERAILDATGRQRLISVVGELLFQSGLECKALLTPSEELRRKNIEDSVRRFETSLSGQLGLALLSTRDALQMALEKRAARSEAIEAEVVEAKSAIAALSTILAELQTAEPDILPAGASTC